jgi:hypothetical protein
MAESKTMNPSSWLVASTALDTGPSPNESEES